MVATLSVPDLTDDSHDTEIKQTSNPRNSLQCVECIVTARKRSCGKVMFLHLSVILFTRGGLSRGVSVRGCLCPGMSLSRGVSVRETPHTVKSGRYASYWNAFLFINSFTREILKVSFKVFLFILFYLFIYFWRNSNKAIHKANGYVSCRQERCSKTLSPFKE